MSQSRTVCPHCERAPGRVHHSSCPRSRESRAALAASLHREPRVIWPGLHTQFKYEVAKPTMVRPNRTEIREAFNPGVPMVRPPKLWTAGGLPRGPVRNPAAPVQGDRRVLALAFKRDFIDYLWVSG